VKVKLRNPDREVHVIGGHPVGTVLKELADEVLPAEIYDEAAP
jgi:hypothetical protein